MWKFKFLLSVCLPITYRPVCFWIIDLTVGGVGSFILATWWRKLSVTVSKMKTQALGSVINPSSYSLSRTLETVGSVWTLLTSPMRKVWFWETSLFICSIMQLWICYWRGKNYFHIRNNVCFFPDQRETSAPHPGGIVTVVSETWARTRLILTGGQGLNLTLMTVHAGTRPLESVSSYFIWQVFVGERV